MKIATRSNLEETLALQLKAAGLTSGMVREHRWLEGRRWRFDFAWPLHSQKLAVEVEGAIWTGGRHTRGAGFEADCEKYNAAQMNGWMVLRFTQSQIKRGDALWLIENVLTGRNSPEIALSMAKQGLL